MDDLPAIVAIFNAAIPTGVTAETAPISVESRRAWFEEHSPERYPLWVEERDGEVADGFERWGRLPRIAEVQGRPVDTVILGRHLEDGSKA